MTLAEIDELAKQYYYNLEPEKALLCYADAFSQYPDLALAYNNYGRILSEMDRPDRACTFLKLAIELDPEERIAPLNLSSAYLKQGDCVNGWEQFESRWRFKHHEHLLTTYTEPRWEGEYIEGKKLLVTCEEGDGDNIQFIRFVNTLTDMNIEVIIQTEPQLKRLLTSSFPSLTVIDNTEQPPEFDYWIPILSIPGVLKITYDNLPKSTKYLTPSKKTISKWKKIVGKKEKSRVGFCWDGRTKNYPFEKITELVQLNNQYEWINLQQRYVPEQRLVMDRLGIKDYFNDIQDWEDTSGLLYHIDAIVSIDTGLIHLAGSMNIPSCLMLDKYATCWRWLMHRTDSPWYDSIRIFKQSTVRGYDEQLVGIHQYLQDLKPKK
jgi:ADP-heptose:LPS heptosyltransferase